MRTLCAADLSRGTFVLNFAALPSHFSAAKLFYDLRLDLRTEKIK